MPLTQPLNSTDLLERFRRGNPGKGPGDKAGIDLTLRPAYRELLTRLGEPQNHLPPVFHVAGTNGKGSTCAFLRAILEAAGYRAHVFTSPHLIHVHERFRLAGNLISENELVALLSECEKISNDLSDGGVTMFEAMTAVAFTAFARNPGDFTILETGLGGRLDATNVVEKPRATLITRLSYDHREFLGHTLTEIAHEKAGILRKGIPCFVAPQPDAESIAALRATASKTETSLFIGNETWNIERHLDGNGFRFTDAHGFLDLPLPALPGAHQLWNAGLAIATLRGTGFTNDGAIAKGLRGVTWPARLQNITEGLLKETLGAEWDLWLDGGHNDSAGEVLAEQMKIWNGDKKPLHLIFGMLKTKRPAEFLKPLINYVTSIHTIPVPDPQSYSAEELAGLCGETGFKNVMTSKDIHDALRCIKLSALTGRILICGSLYLAGDVLRQNINSVKEKRT